MQDEESQDASVLGKTLDQSVHVTPLPTVCLLQCTQRQAWGRGGGQFVRTAGLGLDISSKNLCVRICLAHLVYSESVILTCQLKLSQEDSILKSHCNSHCSYVPHYCLESMVKQGRKKYI